MNKKARDYMSEDSRIEQAAEYQAEQHRASKPLDLMLQSFAPQTMAEAYAVQAGMVSRLAETRGPAVGYKVAYTSTVMRERAGIGQPCYGRIPASMVQDSPAVVDSNEYGGVGIECEVAVKLGSDLPTSGAPYTRESIAEYIEWLAASFEVVDRRDAPTLEGQMPEICSIVTNISNGGAVLGEPITDWQGIELAASRGTMSINGETVGEGVGADVMGHPLEPLVWLANTLAADGVSLEQGALILTGSFAPPVMLKPSDEASIHIDGLGGATLIVR